MNPQSDERNLFRRRLAQEKTLIGQVRRDGEPYPANPDWHDCAFNGDLPPTKEADGMKESYQREEYCSDQRKGSLRHFHPPKN